MHSRVYAIGNKDMYIPGEDEMYNVISHVADYVSQVQDEASIEADIRWAFTWCSKEIEKNEDGSFTVVLNREPIEEHLIGLVERLKDVVEELNVEKVIADPLLLTKISWIAKDDYTWKVYLEDYGDMCFDQYLIDVLRHMTVGTTTKINVRAVYDYHF